MAISKVLSAGDVVYSSANGEPMKVAKVYSCGFNTESGYFSFNEHRKRYWLTRRGYLESIKKAGVQNDR